MSTPDHHSHKTVDPSLHPPGQRSPFDSAVDLHASPLKAPLPSDENFRRIQSVVTRNLDLLTPIDPATATKLSQFELSSRVKQFIPETGVLYVRQYDAQTDTGTIFRDPETMGTLTLSDAWRARGLKNTLIYHEGWFAVPLTTPAVATIYCANGAALVVALGTNERGEAAPKGLIVLGPNGERPFLEYIKTGTPDRILRVGGVPEPLATLPDLRSSSSTVYDSIQSIAKSLGGPVGNLLNRIVEGLRTRASRSAALKSLEAAMPALDEELRKLQPNRQVLETTLRELAIRRGLIE